MMRDQRFEQAQAGLQAFLREQGGSGDVAWLFREDVTAHKRRIVVYLPRLASNEPIAEALFDHAMRPRQNVRLQAHWTAFGTPYASVQVASTDSFQSGRIHFTLATGARAVPFTQSRLRFARTRFFGNLRRHTRLVQDLPGRGHR